MTCNNLFIRLCVKVKRKQIYFLLEYYFNLIAIDFSHAIQVKKLLLIPFHLIKTRPITPFSVKKEHDRHKLQFIRSMSSFCFCLNIIGIAIQILASHAVPSNTTDTDARK